MREAGIQMQKAGETRPWPGQSGTAVLVLADGTLIEGIGVGASGHAAGEVCFNTAMTGYQEILTDPSYAGQIITFTFPHIGNVGANPDDIETFNLAASSGVCGCILRASVTDPSNYRAMQHLDDWLKSRGIIGICGVDTRALTAWIRENGMPNAVIAHDEKGAFDMDALKCQAAEWPGIEGQDLAIEVTCGQSYDWDETLWTLGEGFGPAGKPSISRGRHRLWPQAQYPALFGERRVQGHRGPGADQRGRYSCPQTRWHFSLKWPWRPGGDRQICSA
jgi:carbamoyl-phosphate synthase small subunit